MPDTSRDIVIIRHGTGERVVRRGVVTSLNDGSGRESARVSLDGKKVVVSRHWSDLHFIERPFDVQVIDEDGGPFIMSGCYYVAGAFHDPCDGRRLMPHLHRQGTTYADRSISRADVLQTLREHGIEA